MAEDARDTEEEADGRVGAHGAKRVRPEAQERREPQGTEDEADEAAEQSDHRPRPDRRPHADSVRGGPLFAPLRAEEVDPEDEKGEADNDQQCVTGYHTRQEASDHGESDVPEDEAHETAYQRGREAPEPDEDEDESVQALEYPL